MWSVNDTTGAELCRCCLVQCEHRKASLQHQHQCWYNPNDARLQPQLMHGFNCLADELSFNKLYNLPVSAAMWCNLCSVMSVFIRSLTWLKVGGGGGPGGGGGGGGIGILSLCWHLSVWGKDRWLHRLSWDDTRWLLQDETYISTDRGEKWSLTHWNIVNTQHLRYGAPLWKSGVETL